jgi:pimeloyl-ACP methyl ester carboxylesterase
MTQTLTPIPTVPGTYWQWQSHSIYYVTAGQANNKPPLLLIHGFGASTDHWRKNITELSQDFQVWAIDLLGFGRSAKPEIIYGADLWRDQIADFIQQVIKQPVVIAGNSLGGYTALSVAAQRPETAKGVILLNSAGSFTELNPPPPPNPVVQVINQTLRSLLLQPWASFLLFQYVRQKSVIRKTLEKVYLDRTAITEQLIEDIYRPSCDVGAAQVFGAVFKNPQGEKLDTLLTQLQQFGSAQRPFPLLLIWGEADPWMRSRERGEKFRQYYPALTEYYLSAGHCPHDEIPTQVNGLIRDWLRNNF